MQRNKPVLTLTEDEAAVLQIALLSFYEHYLPQCSQRRKERYMPAMKRLQQLTANTRSGSGIGRYFNGKEEKR